MWNEETVSKLTKLWGEGYSYKQIAARLPGNVSRCAVGGKIDRLGLNKSNPRAVGAASRPRKPKPPRPSINLGNSRRITGHYKPVFPTAAEPLPAPVAEDIARVTLADLEPHHCRWPADGGFCGCDKVPGLPYCHGHAARAYRPASPSPAAFPNSIPAFGLNQARAVEEFTA